MSIIADLRALLAGGDGDTRVNVKADREGNVLSAFGGAPFVEIVRQGRTFYTNTTTAVASGDSAERPWIESERAP